MWWRIGAKYWQAAPFVMMSALGSFPAAELLGTLAAATGQLSPCPSSCSKGF